MCGMVKTDDDMFWQDCGSSTCPDSREYQPPADDK
jgi:hypothetical protein